MWENIREGRRGKSEGRKEIGVRERGRVHFIFQSSIDDSHILWLMCAPSYTTFKHVINQWTELRVFSLHSLLSFLFLWLCSHYTLYRCVLFQIVVCLGLTWLWGVAQGPSMSESLPWLITNQLNPQRNKYLNLCNHILSRNFNSM